MKKNFFVFLVAVFMLVAFAANASPPTEDNSLSDASQSFNIDDQTGLSIVEIEANAILVSVNLKPVNRSENLNLHSRVDGTYVSLFIVEGPPCLVKIPLGEFAGTSSNDIDQNVDSRNCVYAINDVGNSIGNALMGRTTVLEKPNFSFSMVNSMNVAGYTFKDGSKSGHIDALKLPLSNASSSVSLSGEASYLRDGHSGFMNPVLTSEN